MISFSDSPKMLTALAAVTVVLAAANLRSLRQRAHARHDAPQTSTPSTPEPPPTAQDEPPTEPAPKAPLANTPASLAQGLEVGALLDASVELLCADRRTEHVDLRRALPRGQLHLVNIWNVHCDPCIKEFKDLVGVLASAPKTARFVALDTTSGLLPHAAYEHSRAENLPPPAVRLAERVFDPIQREVARIAREQLHLDSNGLPVTFVIDCRQRLRWLKTSRLTPQDTAELTQLLTRLAGDGCTDAPRISVTESVCNPPPPPPLPPIKEIKSRKDCTRCKTGMCKETRRGRLVCDDSVGIE